MCNIAHYAAPSAITLVSNLRFASSLYNRLHSNITIVLTMCMSSGVVRTIWTNLDGVKCALDLVYTLFVGSLYTVDLSQSRIGSCVYAWVTVAIRFLYKHCMLVLSIQCVGSLCNWIFSSTGCGVLLCSLLGLCIRISLLSNMLDLCVYAWVTKQHTYIIHI